MAETEVEDLAALVGIEILPSGVDEEKSAQQNAEETLVSTEVGVVIGSTGADYGDVSSGAVTWDMEKLSALEEEFASRYTESDEEFKQTLATPTHPPPCVSPWWSNNRGYDRSRGRGRDRGWGQGQSRGWGGGHENRHHNNYRNDRPWSYQGHGYQGHHRDDRRDNYRDREPHHGYRDRSPVNRNR